MRWQDWTMDPARSPVQLPRAHPAQPPLPGPPIQDTAPPTHDRVPSHQDAWRDSRQSSPLQPPMPSVHAALVQPSGPKVPMLSLRGPNTTNSVSTRATKPHPHSCVSIWTRAHAQHPGVSTWTREHAQHHHTQQAAQSGTSTVTPTPVSGSWALLHVGLVPSPRQEEPPCSEPPLLCQPAPLSHCTPFRALSVPQASRPQCPSVQPPSLQSPLLTWKHAEPRRR